MIIKTKWNVLERTITEGDNPVHVRFYMIVVS